MSATPPSRADRRVRPAPRLRARLALVVAILAAGAGTACARRAAVPEPPPEPVATPWAATRAAVERLLAEGRYAAADSLLLAIEDSLPPAAQAEPRFWRVLLLLDPANPVATPRAAMAAIDAYLAGGASQPRYGEALVLRRTAARLEALRTQPRPAPVVLGDTALQRQQAEELARLRDSLDRTAAELERIRRRLRTTRPVEPPPR